MLGYPVDEMIGRPYINFVADEDKPMVLSRHKARLAGARVPEQYEIRLSTAQGAKLYCALNVGLSENSEGKILAIGSVRDVTRQKTMQAEIDASRKELESIFDHFPDVFYRTNMQGITIKISPSVFDLLGYRPEEILGTSMASHYYTPEERQKVVQAIIEGGGKATQVEAALKRKDGSVIWVSTSAYTCYEPDGTPFCIEGVARNISERKNMEKALAAREHEMRSLINNSPDTIARYDRDCRRTFVNPAFVALAEGGAASLLGKKPSESPGGPNSTIYEAKINEVFATGKNDEFELQWVGKDGKEICSHIRLTAEHDLSGGITSVLGVGRDISERRRSEKALTESLRKLEEKELSNSRFLAAAGHDLRQPLAAANLFIDALKFAKSPHEQDKIIERLDQAMSTFSGLLDSLLNISKLDSGVIKPELIPINVTEVFNLLEQSLAPIASGKQIGFKLYLPMKKTLVVFSDIGLLNSVLMNLASNAIKFTSKGAILISARKRGHNVLFQIWDTGIGISNEHIENIFDEFYQVGNPQRDRTAGLGLGLAIANRAITLLGSKITCRSRIGRGSVFEFLLPLEGVSKGNSRSATTGASPGDTTNLSYVRGKRFVVVEDDLLVSQALIQSLEGLGGEVECFHNGEEAMRHANIGYADCYIVDYMLGGALEGIQFLNMLRQKLGKPINAVLVTGDTSSSFIRDVTNFDWPVLHKPVNTAKLISTLGAQIGSRV